MPSQRPEGAGNSLLVKFVELAIRYETAFGESLRVTGSAPFLGNWKAEGAGLEMKWTNGHVWRASVPTENIKNEFKYKFVVLNGSGV